MTLVPPLLSTSACSSLVGLSQTAYRCSYYGDGYSWATKDWGYFLPSTPQQSQVKSSKCSRQEANNTSNLERVLQCSHTLGVFKQNDTNIFLFQHTMCQRAPRQLMKWDLAHFLWSWKARAGQHRHICKILQVHHGTTGLRRLLFREMFSLELCASGSSQEPEFSVPECLHEIPRCLFQYHFSIISVTYGGALHQTSTICKLTQLQLRIHRDLLQCVPFNHPHNASKQSPVLPFRSLNTGQCRTLDLPGSLCNPVHLNHEVSAALQRHHLGEDSAPKKFKDVQSRCKSWTIFATFQKFSVWFRIF